MVKKLEKDPWFLNQISKSKPIPLKKVNAAFDSMVIEFEEAEREDNAKYSEPFEDYVLT